MISVEVDISSYNMDGHGMPRTKIRANNSIILSNDKQTFLNFCEAVWEAFNKGEEFRQ